ncbi:prolactin regulatory element-binding protein isoform X1 [Apteryx rowi]|uniref:prolactin regulatory element-binding protein isoform X1 n=1 Tax=Apteryx rowi TaxID=308060 RepID=UPI000E1D248B|nr:prolactin regulatory element-binding protein isoform X1 [Apteryx rowi]
MTMALAGDIIAAGQDASCHILRFSLQAPEAKSGPAGRSGSGEKGPRKRKGPSPAGQGDTQSQTNEVAVETLHSVRTDFSPDALQKAVRFNADCSLLVTGGADGFLRLWEFPSMKKTLEFKAHDGEIEDIALGPDNKVVTAGRDFQCCVWQRDQLVTGLRWNENLPGIPDKAYRYQACRFGAVEDNAGALRLYTVQVPHKRERRPPPCYLTKWDGKSFLPLLTRPCGNEVVSCLSVRYAARGGGGRALVGPGAHCPPPLQRFGHVPGAGHRDGLCRHPHRLLAAEAVLREGGARHRRHRHRVRAREPAWAGAAGRERGGPAQRGRRQPLQAAPAAQPPLPPHLAVAAALRRAHCGHNPAAAARLPWLPVGRPPPSSGPGARTDGRAGPGPWGGGWPASPPPAHRPSPMRL